MKNICLIHIGKTGGTTINYLLKNVYNPYHQYNYNFISKEYLLSCYIYK